MDLLRINITSGSYIPFLGEVVVSGRYLKAPIIHKYCFNKGVAEYNIGLEQRKNIMFCEPLFLYQGLVWSHLSGDKKWAPLKTNLPH